MEWTQVIQDPSLTDLPYKIELIETPDLETTLKRIP